MATTLLLDLEKWLTYDPETGKFWWRKSRGGRLAGAPAGHMTLSKDKQRYYLMIRFRGKLWFAHILAWALTTGALPEKQIDHKNGTSTDNRWQNLRLSTQSQNLQNARKRRDNTSGFKGVSWDKVNQKWVARLRLPGSKYLNLGRFLNVEDAKRAYDQEAVRQFGEFARAA